MAFDYSRIFAGFEMDVRIIPSLLLSQGGLVKTRRFAEPKYVGDPLNAVRTFNEKFVDELMVLDIEATSLGREPDFDLIADIAAECFMPMSYGGAVASLQHAATILASGVEKVVMNTALVRNPDFIADCAREFGSQAVVASLDFKRNIWGKYTLHNRAGKENDPITMARRAEDLGAGELLLTSIDREGTGKGYDLELIQMVSEAVRIPVIANGGAGSLADFRSAVDAGASALSAGSMFVFHGKHRAVLITYPDRNELDQVMR